MRSYSDSDYEMVNYEALEMLNCIRRKGLQIKECLNSDKRHDILSHDEHEVIETCLYKIGCIAGEARRRFNDGIGGTGGAGDGGAVGDGDGGTVEQSVVTEK